MEFDASKPDLTLGVVGAGTMGRGIVQIAAAAGLRVIVYDGAPEAAAKAKNFVAQMLRRQAEKGNMSQDDAETSISRIILVDDIDDLSPCDVVVEAIAEDLEAKRDLFCRLEPYLRRHAILATNTSSLSVTATAAACKRPGRVAGFHFFNPVPLMKVVEIIQAEMTEPWVVEALTDLSHRLGHQPIRAQDTPGFLINQAGRGLYTEGLRIVFEGAADFVDIDRVMREAAGFRMGPFELMDLTGLDVSHPVMESIYRQFYHEPRFRPVPITRRRVAAGLYGRKSGRGYYSYDGQKKIDPPEAAPPEAAPRPVWVGPFDAAFNRPGEDLREALAALVTANGGVLDTGDVPGAESLCLVAPLGDDATSTSLAAGLDPARTVAIDAMFGLAGRLTLMTTPRTDPAMRDWAHRLFAQGNKVTVIRDSAGFIAQRMVATIVNIGCDIAQQRIATPDDINHAVRLGLGYPMGPLELGDTVGAARILTVLRRLEAFYGDPRYRPSPWLDRRARLGMSLSEADS